LSESFDDDYFVIVKDHEQEALPSLKADHNTSQRRYYYERIPPSSPPLVFSKEALI
jgi:hypothetical protein